MKQISIKFEKFTQRNVYRRCEKWTRTRLLKKINLYKAIVSRHSHDRTICLNSEAGTGSVL